MQRRLAFLLILTFLCCWLCARHDLAAAATRVELVIDEPFVDRKGAWPITTGVPFPRGKLTTLAQPERMGEWLQVSDERSAVTGSLRWFWQQFPKEWEATSNQLVLHLWSPRGGEPDQRTLHWRPGEWSIDSPTHYVRHHERAEAWLRIGAQFWASYHRTLETTTLAYYQTGDDRFNDVIEYWRTYFGELAGVSSNSYLGDAYAFTRDPRFLPLVAKELEALRPYANPLSEPDEINARLDNPYAPARTFAATPRLVWAPYRGDPNRTITDTDIDGRDAAFYRSANWDGYRSARPSSGPKTAKRLMEFVSRAAAGTAYAIDELRISHIARYADRQTKQTLERRRSRSSCCCPSRCKSPTLAALASRRSRRRTSS